ncbi:MAG: ABC transporter substrate-binding protein [Syntrophomonas sp.]|uniref:ABC transporter substrate-binding protein n=1 Tax=Syntrophomonas sp. TaxID=2053627 RepID=UPI0026106BE8|nr:ABC transporter substrate-binding protein [Syntrophomonas sp.]MDD2509877.1 ABC transporter substrate-binding protein [Syntrophomonas sp.]MDD3878578.1 ABC transporter substrate-binding protein [Syntrophomonas sp.]MDD4626205.1 ABC transporter substrate-binding protein [Syntrophomonas sp.]
MIIRCKRIVLFIILGALFAGLAFIIHWQQVAVYTASLATRPFNLGLVGEVNSIEPAKLDNHPERLLASTIYEGLLCFDEQKGEIKPGLARKWKYSSDGKSLVLYLRGDVKFHNGKKLKAADVKASWEKNLGSIADWSNVSLFLPIAGCAERLQGKNKDIYGIKVLNEHTLKITLLQPNRVFIYTLNHPVFWVFDSEDKNDPRAGTGPFIFRENKENKKFFLIKNEKYYRGNPRLAAINIQVFPDEQQAMNDYQAGKLDYLDTVPLEEIKKIRNASEYKGLYIEKPILETYSLVFNLNKKPFAGNYHLRRALNYAIDRKKINDEVFGGSSLAAKGAIPTGIPGYSEEMQGYSYKPEKAKELLEEAGYPDGRGLSPLLLTYNSGGAHQMVAEAVAAQLAQLGITVQTQALEWNYYRKQMASMNMSFFRLGWKADYPHTDSFLYSLYHSSQTGNSNFSGYNNPQVNKVLELSRAETDEKERNTLLHRAEQIVVDDAPCLWLFQKKAAKMLGKDVDSLTIDAMEMIDWYQVELFKPEVN